MQKIVNFNSGNATESRTLLKMRASDLWPSQVFAMRKGTKVDRGPCEDDSSPTKPSCAFPELLNRHGQRVRRDEGT